MQPLVDFPRPREAPSPAHFPEYVTGELAARVVLQPIVDLDQGMAYGYEALARFGSRITQTPTAWFVLAQARHESDRLQANVLRAALALRQQMAGDEVLAVNISPDVLAAPRIRHVLADHRPLDGVVIELTEHVHVDDLTGLRAECDRLRAEGARIALDDVGAGWSGLAQIAALEPDILKVARSLVARIDESRARQAAVEALLLLANRIDAVVIAEGLERAEEVQTVRSLGATLGQGFHLGRPELAAPRTGSLPEPRRTLR